MPECHDCARRDARIERLVALAEWFREELAKREREFAAVVRSRDDARRQRDVECARADQILRRASERKE